VRSLRAGGDRDHHANVCANATRALVTRQPDQCQLARLAGTRSELRDAPRAPRPLTKTNPTDTIQRVRCKVTWSRALRPERSLMDRTRSTESSTPMRTGIVASFLVTISIILTGCDPLVRIEGRVLNEDGEPVSRAEALVQCPGLCVYGVTDSQGRVDGGKIGECAHDCELTVRALGYESFVGKIKPFCVNMRRGMCRLVHVDARLKRAAPANAADSTSADPPAAR